MSRFVVSLCIFIAAAPVSAQKGADDYLVTAKGASRARPLADRFADVVNVKDYGAIGDGKTDDTAALQAALDRAQDPGSTAGVVVFPPGLYKVSSPLRVTGGISLVGQNRKGTGPNYRYGPEIRGESEGMTEVVLVEKPGGGVYGFQMRGIMITASTSLARRPEAGLRLRDVSEFMVQNCYFGPGLRSGVVSNGANIGWIQGGDWRENRVGIEFAASASQVKWPGLAGSITWISNVNIWDSAEAAIKVTNGSAYSISVRDSWIEYAKNAFLFTHGVGSSTLVTDFLISGVTYSNGPASPHGDARFILASAQNVADQFLALNRITAENCRVSATQRGGPSAYLVSLLGNSNRHQTTSMHRIGIVNGYFEGGSTAVVQTDLPASVYAFGNTQWTAPAFMSGGHASVSRLEPHTGGWVWETPELSVSGRVKGGRLAATVSPDRGDSSRTLVVGSDAQVQRWATPLTANRTVTLSKEGAVNGDTFRIVRTGLGPFSLDVGGLKTIPARTAAYVEVAYDGTAWRLVGYGAL